MIAPNSAIYLETSAINFLSDYHLPQDGKATQLYHAERNSHFYISPVTIWEILLTNDPIRKEGLIYYMQHIADKNLLCSPPELIFDYIRTGASSVVKRSPTSLPLAKVWKDLCEDNRRTFIYEPEELTSMTRKLRQGFALMLKMVNQAVSDADPEWMKSAGLSLDQLLHKLRTTTYESQIEFNKKCLRVAVILTGIVLCFGIGFDQPVVEAYWKKIKINDVIDRFLHLFVHHESLLYQGPVALMSHVIVSQLQPGGKITRGVLWDAMHALYLLHTDSLWSTDPHFKKLKDEGHSDLFKKIVFLPETFFFPVKNIAYSNRPSLRHRIRHFFVMMGRRIQKLFKKI